MGLLLKIAGLTPGFSTTVRKKRGGRLRRNEDEENDMVGPLSSFGGSSARLRRRMSQASGTSIATEMTFPIRQDAYSATNLRAHSSEESGSKVSPPDLPYPSLASVRGHASSTGPRSTAKGFFASIGRRTSAKRDRPQISRASYRVPTHVPGGALTPQARPIIIEKVPTIPGGPRAIPRRSSVIMISMPSLFPPNTSHANVQNAR